MTEPKFTPGPWHVKNRDKPYVMQENGIALAQIWDCSVISREQADANARLIAAAPDLYDALKHATHTLCVSFCASCLPKGSETGMATFIQNGCPRGSESCDMAKWWELIRKVRDGE